MKSLNILLTGLVLLAQVGPGATQSTVPDWAAGAVWYHIVPERFRNADPRNDPVKERVVGDRLKDWQVHPWASDWYKFQVWERMRQAPFYEVVKDRRYGGDLIGVYEAARYLKALGVDVIRLTPIFESPSVLKYDAATFHHVDNNFGEDREGDWSIMQSQREDPEQWETTHADELFFELVEYVHKLDMRVVLEAVFSYCGREFWAFKDLIENQETSKYKDWFVVLSWDDPFTPDTSEFDYAGWQGNKDLPVFRQDENGPVAPVKQYIFDSTRRWMDPDGDGRLEDGVDGWCIRDAEGLPPQFWREWHDLVKSINPEAVTVTLSGSAGAVDGFSEPFDLTDDPDFAKLLDDFFIHERLSVGAFDAELAKRRARYGELSHSVLNWLDSPSTARLSSRIVNARTRPANGGAKANDRGSYDPRKPNDDERQLQRLIAFFQLTYVGAPVIFYGDESGMWGGPFPDNLKPMMWREFTAEPETYANIRPDLPGESRNVFDVHFYGLYRVLNKARHENPALRRGSFEPLLVDDERGLYIFLRKYENNEVLVCVNRSLERQTVKLKSPWKKGVKFKDYLHKEKHTVKEPFLELDLTKHSGLILVKEK